MQGFHPCTPLKGLLKKSLKNLQNFINLIYQCFSKFLGVQPLFVKRGWWGVGGKAP
jgi:hypothetical protein